MCRKLFYLFHLILALGFAVSVPVWADMLCHWKFDGSLGSDLPVSVIDETGNYTATHIEGTDADSRITYAEPNPFNPGTSAYFYNDNWSNDAGDVLLIPDAGVDNIEGLDFGPLSEFTIEAFIRPSSGLGSTQTRRIFSKDVYCYMYLDRYQTLHAIRKWGGGDWDVKWTHLAASDIPLDEWTRVKMTWDAHAVDDKFKLYINGALADSAPGNCLPTADSTAGFAIGGYEREAGTRAQYFCGKIDEFKITGAIRDPGRYLTDPHRPVVVEASPYPTVNILLDDNATVTAQVVQIDANTFGPIDPSFTRQMILELDPLTVTAGVLAKLTPDGNTPGPGRYEYHLTRTTAGEPNYHRTMPFTVLDYGDKDRGTPSDANGIVYRDNKPWLPITVYVNSRTGSGPNTLLRDRFLDYFEGTGLCMMDYCVPRGGYNYVQDFLDRAQQRSIPIMFHTPLYYFADSEDYAVDEWFPGQDPMEVLHELIRRFRDHPAVVLHYTNDERPDSMHGELRRMQTELLRHDPFHPTVVQHYGYDKIESQADTYDIYVQQRYNNDIRTFLPSVVDIESHMIDPIPFWVNMRSNNPNIKTSSYICIASGAKGLMFYKFATLWDDQETFDSKWALLVDMAEEIQSRQHILLQPPSLFQCTIDVDEVAIRTVDGNHGMWVLIANAYWQTRNATVTVPPGTISAVGADGTNYPVSNNEFDLVLTPEGAWLIRLFVNYEPPQPLLQPLRVDIGTADNLKPGWTLLTKSPYEAKSSAVAYWNVADTGINATVDTGEGSSLAGRTSSGGPLGIDYFFADGQSGTPGGDFIITLDNLFAGSYTLTTYHNSADGPQSFLSSVDVSGAVSAAQPDAGVIQTAVTDDAQLGFSNVTFTATGAGNVVVRYVVGDSQQAWINGFELARRVFDFDELAAFSGYWLDRCRVDEWCEGYDINRDSRVDFGDFAIFALNWAENGP